MAPVRADADSAAPPPLLTHLGYRLPQTRAPISFDDLEFQQLAWAENAGARSWATPVSPAARPVHQPLSPLLP